MKTLKFNYDCLDGYYELYITFDDSTLEYATSTNIDAFLNKEGTIETPSEFIKLVDEAGIEKWNKEYLPTNNPIEDATSWSIKYIKDDKEYISKGEETYYPYGYEKLLEALKLVDDKLIYFD